MPAYIRGLGLALAMAVMVGCDGEFGDIEDSGDIRLRGLVTNGLEINSFRLNSFRLNGEWLGAGADDIKLVQAHLADGSSIAESWLVGGNLHVQTESGAVRSGAQLGGAKLVFDVIKDGTLTQGQNAKIVSVKPLAGAAEVWLYDVAVEGQDGTWEPLCVEESGAPTQALLLGGAWDPTTGDRVPLANSAVTLACRGAALAKCVEWGYVPWKVHGATALAEAHQACTRAVRADYCGDGTPHTVNGVKIHVKDPLGIQVEDMSLPHVVEAEWGPDGALCLNHQNKRMPGATVACSLSACDAPKLNKGMLQSGKVLSK